MDCTLVASRRNTVLFRVSVIVLFSNPTACVIVGLWTSSEEPHRGETQMHDLLIGLTFVAMVLSPAIVAACSGTSETNVD